jgi:hypothetical protein
MGNRPVVDLLRRHKYHPHNVGDAVRKVSREVVEGYKDGTKYFLGEAFNHALVKEIKENCK